MLACWHFLFIHGWGAGDSAFLVTLGVLFAVYGAGLVGPHITAATAGERMTINFGLFGVKILGPTTLTVWLGPTLTRSFIISEGSKNVDITLGDNQFTTIHLKGLDAAGLAGAFVKPPVWAVDDPTVVTITPAADGTTCRIEATVPAKLGTATVSVSDADDPNVAGLTFPVTVVGEQIVTLGATVDPPQERTPAA